MKLIRPITVTPSNFTSSNVTEAVAVWAAGTTYAEGDFARNDTTNRVYESLVAGNIGNDPTLPANSTKWLDIRPIAGWAMFDAYNQTQTEKAASIAVVLNPVGIVNAVALLNIEAASATIKVTDTTAGVVYNETIPLVSTSNVGSSFYAWCFEPIIRKTDANIDDLPAYADTTIEITLDDAAGIAKCGNCIIGAQRLLGATTYGATFSIVSASRKIEDDFGNITIVPRGYRKTGNFAVVVPSDLTDEIVRLLTLHRDEPVVYVGTGEFDSSIIFGFYRDFSMAVDHFAQSKLSIQIEGLS